jgi:hypothetical protein
VSEEFKKKVLQVLENSPIPMGIQEVRFKTDIKNWTTSKAILLELLAEEKINGQMTTKSWIFWKKAPESHAQNQKTVKIAEETSKVIFSKAEFSKAPEVKPNALPDLPTMQKA